MAEAIEENEQLAGEEANGKPEKNKKKNKKEKQPLSSEEEKAKKRKHTFRLIKLLLVLAILILIYMYVNNRFGFRDKVTPALRNVPVVKNHIPPAQEDEQYAALSKEELISQNKLITQENEQLKSENQTLNNTINGLNDEIKRLKEIEEQQISFKQQQKEFDELVASEEPKDFTSFYEQMNPDNAKEIYQRITEENQLSKEAKQYIEIFETMKKDSCASILEELITTDMDLVIDILNNLSTSKQSDILSAMSVENAAACAKRMSNQ